MRTKSPPMCMKVRLHRSMISSMKRSVIGGLQERTHKSVSVNSSDAGCTHCARMSAPPICEKHTFLKNATNSFMWSLSRNSLKKMQKN